MNQCFDHYVAVLGDAACRPGWQNHFPRVIELLWQTYHPSHVFVPGDVATDGRPEEHEEVLTYCTRYSWQWVVAMGDHDKPLHIFQRYWGPAHKVTDQGQWRFIGVDTSAGDFSENEAAWLRSHIRDRSVIYMHVPPRIPSWAFHCLDHESSERFFAVLNDFRERIHACFFGHIHSYDRKAYKGIPLIVTGAGGAEARGLGPDGYSGTRPFEAIAFDLNSGAISLLEDVPAAWANLRNTP